jgi:pSer/pThr/pTyr-binding forkhead associated (FHA) protein
MSQMSELTLTIIKLGFLAVLWLFVLTAVSVMRSDLFGRRVNRTPPRRPGVPATPPAASTQRVAKPGKATKAPKGRRGVPSALVVTQGALSGTTVRLGDQPVTLGRSQDSTIVLDDDYVSSRHARFFPRDGQWLVEDMGSTNGTYLDRTKVTQPTAVKIGMPLRIGKTVVELRK